ncbi:hypothetical protein B484DRAFT_164462 [Ochromonadaceae sp. CCMP2298]|nr:hypothetical protein B484DRAFT_164462 [Ochromonadaceae sp. CCMP2298]
MGCTSSQPALEGPAPLDPAELLRLAKQQTVELRLQRLASLQQQLDSLQPFTPEAGFVLKTRRTSTNQKVFINIMHHDSIPLTDGEVGGGGCITRDERAVLPTSLYHVTVADPVLTNESCLRLLSLLNELYPQACLDLDYKVPKIGKYNYVLVE